MEQAEKYNAKDANAQVRRSRATGWPNAHRVLVEYGQYVIATHKADCRCGYCPLIRTDGYVN